MEGAGFEVINLGINVDADQFINAVREHNADLLGMSALLHHHALHAHRHQPA